MKIDKPGFSSIVECNLYRNLSNFGIVNYSQQSDFFNFWKNLNFGLNYLWEEMYLKNCILNKIYKIYNIFMK
jgi:hypothetical protein